MIFIKLKSKLFEKNEYFCGNWYVFLVKWSSGVVTRTSVFERNGDMVWDIFFVMKKEWRGVYNDR